MRRVLCLMAGLISGLLLAAPAMATTTIDLSDDGSRLTLQSEPRERERITLHDKADDPGGQKFTVTAFPTALQSNTPACEVEKHTLEWGDLWQASCPTDRLRGVVVRTRSRNDSLRLHGTLPDLRWLRATLGSGKDQTDGWRSHFPNAGIPMFVDGGRGGDRLYGGFGPDHLIGGEGSDYLTSASGADRIDAQDGVADQLLHCGPGDDSIVFDIGFDPAPQDCEP